MNEQDIKLQIVIRNSEPIELVDFTKSLISLADEYKRHLSTKEDTDIRLYLSEIKTGSIIAEIIARAPDYLPFLEHATTILDFCNYLKIMMEWLWHGGTKPEEKIQKQTLQNVHGFLEPIAKDRASQINVNTIINGAATFVFNLNSTDANAIQNSVMKEIQKLKEPSTGKHEKVVLYWYQARNDMKSDSGDKAIIESISTSPVKTIFFDDAIKQNLILNKPENPFKKAYIVDVQVETIEGKPILYKILSIHEEIL